MTAPATVTTAQTALKNKYLTLVNQTGGTLHRLILYFPQIPDESVSLVVTSPPFLDVVDYELLI